jgi:septal ring factor EnvC (AmiA/AmiB activator)
MIALLAIGLVAAGTPSPPAHRPLDDVQTQLEEEREIAAQIAGREATLLGRLAELERQIDLTARANRVAQARLRSATAQLLAAEERARAAQAEVKRRLDALSPRLVARYKLGREGYLRFLLGAQSIADLLKRRRLFDALIASDFDDLTRLRFAEQGAEGSRDELAQAQAELSRAAREEADKRAALEQRAREQRKLLAAVQEEKALHEEAVAELEEAERALTGRIGELQKSPQASQRSSAQLHAPSFKSQRGKLRFPVEGGRIEVHFGRAVDPRFGTVTVQRGIDVRCPEGTTVHAIAAGTVAHAGWFRGYGNLLIVDHGHGYFSLMAHLATLTRAKDDLVRAGEEVGTVGDTGSLKGAYLYFELRDGQTALDPERWLVKPRQKGTTAALKLSRKP